MKLDEKSQIKNKIPQGELGSPLGVLFRIALDPALGVVPGTSALTFF